MTLKSLGIFFVFTLLMLSSCGYNLRGDNRAFFEKYKIQKIYVAPAKNLTFKAGAEIIIYNALRKRIAQGGYVKIVSTPKEADAIMYEHVVEVGSTPLAAVSPPGMSSAATVEPGPTGALVVKPVSPYPGAPGPSNVAQFTSLAQARLRVRFQIYRQGADGKSLWSQEFTQVKNYSNSVYLGAEGNTSALISASEFERALSDLSTLIVTDAEESVNSLL